MLDLRRSAAALGMTAVLALASGCAGIGVNIGSGAKGATNISGVLIQTLDGTNQLLVNVTGCLTVQAVATTSGTPNGVASVQGAIWKTGASTDTASIALFEADCVQPYQGEAQQVVGIKFGCVSVVSVGPNSCVAAGQRRTLAVTSGTGTVFATVQGITGKNTVTVFF